MNLSNVDVADMLERLGIRNARPASGGAEMNFSCPQPGHAHGDEDPSAYMNTETTAFFCQGCKWRGNALSFVEFAAQVSRATAQRLLREWYGIDFDEPHGGSMVGEIEARFSVPEDRPPPLRPTEAWLRSMEFAWGSEPLGEPQKYIIDRGLNLDTLEHWDVGYDYVSDRPTFPVRNVAGELVGIKGRAWRADQEPRYLILGDRPGRPPRYGFAPYDPSEVVFGLERERHETEVVLVEGELNAMALWQLGVSRPVATGMSYFTDHHARLLISEARQVIIFYDSDKAGQEGVWGRLGADGQRAPGIVSKLEPFMSVRVIQGHIGDPLDMVVEGREAEARDLLAHAQSTLALSTIFE
jgi:DNA primase